MIFGEAGATQEPKLLSLSFGTGQLWSSQTLLISVAQTVVYLLFMLHVQHGSGVVGGGAQRWVGGYRLSGYSGTQVEGVSMSACISEFASRGRAELVSYWHSLNFLFYIGV